MHRTEAGRPLRLLHVIPSFAVGGVPVRLVTIANRLGRRYRHLVLALDGVTHAAARFAPDTDYALLPLAIDKRQPVRNLLRFRRVIRDVAPDLMLTYNWGAVDWAIANLPVPACRHIHFEDGFGPDEFHGQLRRRVLGRRFGLIATDRVVVPSRTLESIARDIWKLPPKQIRYLPNGVDLARFRVAPDRALRDRLGLPLHEPVVGTVAPLRPEKNLGRLLRAFALATRARPARLLIVGDGSERARLEAEATALGIAARVTFAGNSHEPERFLALFDLFAMSSETEQMPIAALEAMAAGLPVTGTEVGDLAIMVAPESRSLIVSRDDEALAGALRRLLDDHALRQRLGAANRAHAALHYDQEAMFQEHELLLQGRIGPQAAAARARPATAGATPRTLP